MNEKDSTSEKDDRPRGILSEGDREFLREERDLSDSAARNARHRIRRRVQAAMTDFELLWNFMSDRDMEQIFHPDSDEERNQVRVASHQALSFIRLGLWQNRDPHAGRVEDAVEQAAFAAGYAAVATMTIDAEPIPDGELLLAKMAHKEDRMAELRERLYDDELDEETEAELMAELEKEATFQYYLFEKAIRDPEIEPSKLADVEIIGVSLEMTAEDIVKERTGWAKIPVQRQSVPKVINIEHRAQEAAGGIVQEIDKEDE